MRRSLEAVAWVASALESSRKLQCGTAMPPNKELQSYTDASGPLLRASTGVPGPVLLVLLVFCS